MTPRSVSIETSRVLSMFLKKLATKDVEGLGSSLSFGGSVAVELEENTRKTTEELLREISEKRLPLPSPRLMIVEKFCAEELTLDRFLGIEGDLKAEHRTAVSVFLYPFGERLSNTLVLPLWGREDVRLIVPKSLGILIKHSVKFDPYAYLLGVSKSTLLECVKGSSNPYVLALTYEMRRSFGYTKLKEALGSDLVLNESARQAFARFYDVEGALKLLKWIRHGCVKVIRREVRSAEELHPLSVHLFRAQAFFR